MLPVVKLLQSHPIVVNDAEGRDGSRTALDELEGFLPAIQEFGFLC